MRPAVLGGMLAAARLNAGFLIAGDDEFIVLQDVSLPLASILNRARDRL
jgi:hypothetical protein